MKFKQYIWVLLAAAVIGAGLGGAAIGITHLVKNQSATASSQTTLPTTSTSTPLPSGQNILPAGAGTTGIVQAIDGSKLTLKTSSGSELNVVVDSSTRIQKTVLGALTDIVTGSNIIVSGTQQSDGSINASSLSIMAAGSLNTPPGTQSPSLAPPATNASIPAPFVPSTQTVPPAMQPSSLVPPVTGALPTASSGPAASSGMMGAVQSVEGGIVIITTRDGSSVRIVVNSNTVIQKIITGSLADILIDSNITVSGSQQSDGSLRADTVAINASSEA